MSDKRDYGTGHLYIDLERDAYYGRWRTASGRQLNRKVGPVRHRGESDGLTRAEAEKKFRKMQEDEDRKPRLPRARLQALLRHRRSVQIVVLVSGSGPNLDGVSRKVTVTVRR
jgi:hypothetical protein